MSPILDLQKRLRQIGTVRYGELVSKNGKTYPSTRDTWRVTTGDENLATQIAQLFGGEAKEWDSRSAERYVVDTNTNRLPIAVVPGHALTQYYELWSGGGCKRRCDGQDEMISSTGCICDPEQRECKPTTRFSFVIRGIDSLGLFRLNTTGYYAAVELAGAVEFLEQYTVRGEAPAGWIRIEERRVVRDGQTKVFKVPVLDVAFGIDRMIPVAAEQPAIPANYKPLTAITEGVTLEQGLGAVDAPAVVQRNARSAAPIPAAEDMPFGPFEDTPVPVPVDEPIEQVRTATEPQRRKIFATARDRGVNENRLRELVAQVNDGNESTQELPRPLVDAVLAALEAEPAQETMA